MPADVLPNSQYNVVKKGKSCEHSKIGAYVDGTKRGKKATVCIDTKCPIHGTSLASSSNTSPEHKAKRAAAKREVAMRSGIFVATHKAATAAKLDSKSYLVVAEYALNRVDHNGLMRLANLIGWPKELFSWNGKARS
jgi:hypothetical protein